MICGSVSVGTGLGRIERKHDDRNALAVRRGLQRRGCGLRIVGKHFAPEFEPAAAHRVAKPADDGDLRTRAALDTHRHELADPKGGRHAHRSAAAHNPRACG